MADYFLGRWSGGTRKPFTTKSGENGDEDRLVAAQPNAFKNKSGASVDDSGGGGSDVFNYRKLSELPRHLIETRDLVNLKKHVLFNYEFLLSKLQAFGYQSLIEDVSDAIQVYSTDKEIKTLHEVLKMSARTLLIDPHQLPTQLYGRLLEKNITEHMKRLMEDAFNSGSPCLIPSKKCFEAPGGSLLHSLAGHVGLIDHVSFTEDGKKLVSVGSDSTLRYFSESLPSGQNRRKSTL